MATVAVSLAQGVEKLEAVAIAETRSGESRIAATGLSRTVHVSGLKITSREISAAGTTRRAGYLKPKRVPKRIRLRSRLYGSRFVVELPKP